MLRFSSIIRREDGAKSGVVHASGQDKVFFFEKKKQKIFVH